MPRAANLDTNDAMVEGAYVVVCAGAECGDADGSTDRSFVNDVAMATTHPHRLANKTQNSNWGSYVSTFSVLTVAGLLMA